MIVQFVALSRLHGVRWHLVFAHPSRKDAPTQLREDSPLNPISRFHYYSLARFHLAAPDENAREPG